MRKGIGIITTCDYQNCGENKGFNVRAMFSQFYFALPVNHKKLHNCFLIHFIISPVCLFCKEL